jgi:hypothetical protein
VHNDLLSIDKASELVRTKIGAQQHDQLSAVRLSMLFMTSFPSRQGSDLCLPHPRGYRVSVIEGTLNRQRTRLGLLVLKMWEGCLVAVRYTGARNFVYLANELGQEFLFEFSSRE